MPVSGGLRTHGGWRTGVYRRGLPVFLVIALGGACGPGSSVDVTGTGGTASGGEHNGGSTGGRNTGGGEGDGSTGGASAGGGSMGGGTGGGPADDGSAGGQVDGEDTGGADTGGGGLGGLGGVGSWGGSGWGGGDPRDEWVLQFGAPDASASGRAACRDLDGNLWVAGHTSGVLEGELSAGSLDALVSVFDSNGATLDHMQFGTSGVDVATAVAADQAGHVYVLGATDGTFATQTSAGEGDCWLMKLDALGTVEWTRQFGTADNDGCAGVAVAADGSIYVGGYTEGTFPTQASSGGYDSFLAKYDAAGTPSWVRQFGTDGGDYAYGLAIEAGGGIVLAGATLGAFPGFNFRGITDAFTQNFDPTGASGVTRQFGTSGQDVAESVAAHPGGGIVVGGSTNSSWPEQDHAGDHDGFVRGYDPSGTVTLMSLIGSPALDYGQGITADADGNVYLTGYAADAIVGQTSQGGYDAFLRVYGANNSPRFTLQFGTDGDDHARAVVADDELHAYVVGITFGTFPGHVKVGAIETFVMKVLVP